jgi:hypothetical protein
MIPGVREYVRGLINKKVNPGEGDQKVPVPLKDAFHNFTNKLSGEYESATKYNKVSPYLLKEGKEYVDRWWPIPNKYTDEYDPQRRMERYVRTRDWATDLALQPGMTPEKFNELTREFFKATYWTESMEKVLSGAAR